MKLGKVNKFQVGGQMPTQGAEDPMMIMMQGAAQAIQAQDCQMAMQVCQMLLELAGGAAPATPETAPATEASEPVFKMGGKLSRRIKA